MSDGLRNVKRLVEEHYKVRNEAYDLWSQAAQAATRARSEYEKSFQGLGKQHQEEVALAAMQQTIRRAMTTAGREAEARNMCIIVLDWIDQELQEGNYAPRT